MFNKRTLKFCVLSCRQHNSKISDHKQGIFKELLARGKLSNIIQTVHCKLSVLHIVNNMRSSSAALLLVAIGCFILVKKN